MGPQVGYVTGLQLESIQAFEDLKIDLKGDDGPRMLSVIIGRNGTCKSTLLRCIALGLCHESDASSLLSQMGGRLVSEGANEGRITLWMADPSGKPLGEIRLRIGINQGRDVLLKRDATVTAPDFFVCGYGAGRGTGVTSTQVRPYRGMDSVATLFDYNRGLLNSELMLRRLQDHLGSERYDRAMKGIKRVLGLQPGDQLECAKGGGVIVSGPGIGDQIPLEGWADGYRMTVTWMIDLYAWAMQANTDAEDGGVQGILLVDEIEQHLHPSMQAPLLNELRDALPQMQVFATIHSALTALGTSSENVIALHRKDRTITMASVPSLVGYSAEDVLVEESLFGTDPYPVDTRKKLDRHRKLASVLPSKRTRKQTDEITALAAELDPAKLPGLRDDPVIQKLDQLEELMRKDAKP